MNKFNEKQKASFNRSIDRAVARAGWDEDRKLSLFIRVAESRIYHGKPVLKALLKEVIYLRMTDLHEDDTRIPKGTPWSHDHSLYEGWCYARQEYLARRVGSEPTYVSKALKKIVEDGYLKPRKYRGRDGAWHKQYFPDEVFIDAKIKELEAAETSDKSVGGAQPLAIMTTAHLPSVRVPSCHNDNRPLAMSATGHLPLCPEPLAMSASKVCSSGLSFEVGARSATASTTTSTPPLSRGSMNRGVAVAPTPKEKNKTNPYSVFDQEFEDLESLPEEKAKTKAIAAAKGFDPEEA